MSCNASDSPSLLAPLLSLQQQQQQQYQHTSNVAAVLKPITQLAPLASSSSLGAADPPPIAQHSYGTRTRQHSILKPTIRALYSSNNPSFPASASAVPLSTSPSSTTVLPQKEQPKQRRIRPLIASTTSGSSSDSSSKSTTGVLKGILKGTKDAGRKPLSRASPEPAIEFPPSHVVLHPDDASNKVFLAIGRAFMSVGNRAMTIKDLAELSLKQGLACQNASAAAQAITFFIRSHLQRCEDEQDFPLLLRHVLSGTSRDDALISSLYSRVGGNVTNHKSNANANSSSNASSDPSTPAQEKPAERLTNFRRGTTVWYLSRASGAPCPFASAGIALRDYSECSGITGAESRRGPGSSTALGTSSGAWSEDEEEPGACGMKRKRAGLRTRTAAGTVAGMKSKAEEPVTVDDDVMEGRKPPKVKLTLRLRPPRSCLSIVSKPAVAQLSDDSDSSSDESDSDDESDGSMDIDPVNESTPVKTTTQPIVFQQEEPQPFTFPPFPLQRRISIPPYTPAEEDFPAGMSHHRQWSFATSSFNTDAHSIERREASVPLSVASPPPDSDDEDLADAGDEADSPTLSIVKKEEEVPFRFDWPLSVTSSSSDADVQVKSEDVGFNLRAEPEDFGFSALNLGLDVFDTIKVEDDSDDMTAIYMRALASVMPSQSTDDDLGDDFDVDSVVCRAGASSPPLSGWQDAVEDISATGVAVSLMTEPDFERDWVEAEGSEGAHTSSESHANDLRPPTSERSSSPALTFAASSPADSSMSSSDAHDDDEGDSSSGSDDERPASPPQTVAPALFFGPDLRDGSRTSFISRRNSPCPSPAALLSRTNSATGKPRIPIGMSSSSLPMPVQQQRPPSIADAADLDAFEEGRTPWERGMLTVADVEAHLLPALSPTFEYPSSMPYESALFPLNADSFFSEPPLSPQEEEVFQSFCLFDSPSSEPAPEPRDDAGEEHEDAVFSKTSKRTSKAEVKEPEEALEESAKPLRRSKRVANVVASQQTAAARARLRRRS